jgi:hypothetical protein
LIGRCSRGTGQVTELIAIPEGLSGILSVSIEEF